MPESENLLPRPIVAKFLGVSERTVFDLTKNGKLPSIRIGSLVRYDPADLRAFANKNKTAGGVAVAS